MCRTEFDLLTEYYEDYYKENPLEAHRNEDGHIQFKDTGDPLIDEWEEKIARGEAPDLTEAFSEEQWKKLKVLQEKGRKRTAGRTMAQTHEDVGAGQQERLRKREGWSEGPEGLGKPPIIPPTFGDD